RLLAGLPENLNAERERLDRQDRLNDLWMADERTALLYQDVRKVETDETRFQNPLDDWLTLSVRLHRQRAEYVPDGITFAYTTQTELPPDPWRRVMQREAQRPGSFCREIANDDPCIYLLRPGASFIDVVEQLVHWHDRGVSFGTWRVEPTWPEAEQGAWVGFRVVLIVEPVLTLGERDQAWPARANVQRRLNGFLPLFVAAVAVDVDLDLVDAPLLLTILERPFKRPGAAPASAAGDYLLGRCQAALFELIDPAVLVERCQRLPERATTWLQANADLQARLQQ